MTARGFGSDLVWRYDDAEVGSHPIDSSAELVEHSGPDRVGNDLDDDLHRSAGMRSLAEDFVPTESRLLRAFSPVEDLHIAKPFSGQDLRGDNEERVQRTGLQCFDEFKRHGPPFQPYILEGAASTPMFRG